ncbi:caspase family protein [uncultured Rhodoblastus sp.]|uniref:caspase family protein n=1 Tax=uncultured Rhodoblastus sp. TaxID=543037 RepID=UPI0025E92630|nr:caspase family protein [uncultured Rhodoblastus sp.]
MTRQARFYGSARFFAAVLMVGALTAGRQQISAQPASATSSRLALVIGEAGYKNGPLSSAANDAGLIADTLQKAGFDVTGAADLDQNGLRLTLRDFVDKASIAGPNAMVFIYLAGRGVQYEGENYLAPVDAVIPRAVNVPLEAVRLRDYLQPLSQMPLKARVIVLDAARINAFAQDGAPLAGGLALVEPEPGELIAFNAAPGSVAPAETGPYGVYAQALSEMLREGGLPLDAAFARTRLRVSERTRGAQVPWSESKILPAPALFARAPGAPPPAVAFETQANMRARPIRDFPVDQAYGAALEQDTLSAYVDFLNAYPNSAYAERARAMLALRREAVTWRRAWLANMPGAYWTYLQFYPRGPHAEDARRRLGLLNVALLPPPRFDAYAFDVPPPADAEEIYFNRPYVVFDDPAWGAPPPMTYLLPERPFLVERAPPAPPYAGLLPLVAAPLLFAIPAVRQGIFHAPAAVTAQQPGADAWYSSRNGKPPGAAPATPGAPSGKPLPPGPQRQNAAPPSPGKSPGTPLPHQASAPGAAPVGTPGGAALPHGPQPPKAAPPAVTPLPHPANATGSAPAPQAPKARKAPKAPIAAPPGGTVLPHTANAPNAPPGRATLPRAPQAPNAAPPGGQRPAVAPVPHGAPPHPDAPRPQAEPQRPQTPRPAAAPPTPPPAAPPAAAPHPAAPPQPGPPKLEPPHGAPSQQQRPRCGTAGEAPCR